MGKLSVVRRGRSAFVLVAVAGLFHSRLARAEVPENPRGLLLGVRTGYAIPLGSLSGGQTVPTGLGLQPSASSPLSDTISGQIPVWFDIGYRFNRHWDLSAYGMYGYGLVPTNVCKGESCSIHDVRGGAAVRFHFAVSRVFDPWIALGGGIEQLGASVSGQSVSFLGWEPVNVQVGGDYWASSYFNLGPFVDFSLAEYASASSGGQPILFPAAFHEWVILGLRGEFNLGSHKPKEAPPSEPAVGVMPPPLPPPFIAPPPPGPGMTAPLPPAPIPVAPSPAPPPVVLAPVPRLAWAGIPIADRTQCTLTCTNNLGSVDASRVEGPLHRQLGAFRGCSQSTRHEAARALTIQFDPAGTGVVQYDMRTVPPEAVECVSRIPQASIRGTAGEVWRCSDYCE